MTPEEQKAADDKRRREEEATALLLALFLYNATVRRQIYLEWVKNTYATQYDVVIQSVMDDIKNTIDGQKETTFANMNKANFLILRATIGRLIDKRLVEFHSKTTKDLKDFMARDVELAHNIYRDPINGDMSIDPNGIKKSAQKNAHGNSVLWALVSRAFVPAAGMTMLALLSSVITGASSKILRVLTISYANGETLEQTAKDIRAAASSIINGGRGILSTVFQHVGAQAQDAVASTQYGSYIWTSIIDGRTTQICLSRNMKIFEYGRGPIPPAHYGCRSIVVPVVEGMAHTKQTYYSWLRAQPEEVQDDILGAKRGRDLRSGEFKADDLDRYDGANELTLEQYSGKAGFILRK